jgi:hypothetical protein
MLLHRIDRDAQRSGDSRLVEVGQVPHRDDLALPLGQPFQGRHQRESHGCLLHFVGRSGRRPRRAPVPAQLVDGDIGGDPDHPGLPAGLAGQPSPGDQCPSQRLGRGVLSISGGTDQSTGDSKGRQIQTFELQLKLIRLHYPVLTSDSGVSGDSLRQIP